MEDFSVQMARKPVIKQPLKPFDLPQRALTGLLLHPREDILKAAGPSGTMRLNVKDWIHTKG